MSEGGPGTADTAWPARFAEAFTARYGERLLAVVMYGSWLRGKRDTVLDFYLVFDTYAALRKPLHGALNRVLPPNVYNLVLEHDGQRCSAKYATMSLAQLEHAIRHAFHSYFWARFAQPVVVLYARSAKVEQRIARCGRDAAQRMLHESADCMQPPFTSDELWRTALGKTYICELRSEPVGKAAELVEKNREHFAALTAELAAAAGLLAVDREHWAPAATPLPGCWRWSVRRVQGKLLSLLRLFKAAFTFNQPLDYILWKVERHSGIREQASERQRRHPLIFAWPVLWRLYRRGGFR